MVKTAAIPGQVVKQTNYTEVLPANTGEKSDGEKLGFWEYLQSLTANDYAAHICYVYRWRQNENDYSTVGKLSLPFDEMTLKENYGGGIFRLYLKRNGQLYKRIDRVVIEGNPKNPDDAPHPVTAVAPMPNGELGLLARILENQNQLFERFFAQNNSRPAVDEAFRGALQLQADALRTGVETVRQTVGTPAVAPAAGPMDDLMKQFITAAISKMMNPADPIEAFSKMATAFSSLNLGNNGGGSTSWGVEAIRAIGQALPQIAQAVTAGYAASQLPARPMAQDPRTINMQPAPVRANADDRRADVVQMPGQTAAALPPVPATEKNPAVQAPQAAPPPQGGDPMAPNVEWVEMQVVNIIQNQELSPEDAAHEAAAFIQNAAPVMLPQLAVEMNLRWLFNNRTQLSKVPADARREAFIVAFLAILNGAPEPAQADTKTGDGLLLTPEPPPA